jgi:hypothetical protein
MQTDYKLYHRNGFTPVNAKRLSHGAYRESSSSHKFMAYNGVIVSHGTRQSRQDAAPTIRRSGIFPRFIAAQLPLFSDLLRSNYAASIAPCAAQITGECRNFLVVQEIAKIFHGLAPFCR